ncbi:putative ccaat-binding factor complex subunit protein [Lasiodiplodia theobromae]|nr:putative ccaat-binding factor complex subunit protein [Lasiodiplodia theobromae]
MSSASPPSSQSPPQNASKGRPESAASDANIRNFAPVARIMKMALPENAKIAKEAKECMQECVSEFISFITSEASEKCQQEKRKTVNGEDILFAMTSLGFENYAEALKIYLSRYRENKPAVGFQQQGNAAAGAGSSASGGANASAAYAGAEGASNNNLLSGDVDTSEQDNSAFGYTVGHHNGNGSAEF